MGAPGMLVEARLSAQRRTTTRGGAWRARGPREGAPKAEFRPGNTHLAAVPNPPATQGSSSGSARPQGGGMLAWSLPPGPALLGRAPARTWDTAWPTPPLSSAGRASTFPAAPGCACGSEWLGAPWRGKPWLLCGRRAPESAGGRGGSAHLPATPPPARPASSLLSASPRNSSQPQFTSGLTEAPPIAMVFRCFCDTWAAGIKKLIKKSKQDQGWRLLMTCHLTSV